MGWILGEKRAASWQYQVFSYCHCHCHLHCDALYFHVREHLLQLTLVGPNLLAKELTRLAHLLGPTFNWDEGYWAGTYLPQSLRGYSANASLELLQTFLSTIEGASIKSLLLQTQNILESFPQLLHHPSFLLLLLLLLDGWGMMICENWQSLPTRCTWQSHDFPLLRCPCRSTSDQLVEGAWHLKKLVIISAYFSCQGG